MHAAAIYTRSSTDRSDGASIAAQERTIKKTARDMKLPIVAKYSDVVESGKDPFRPGFQRLLADMANPDRGWNTLILYDTSRLFRGQFYAQMFKHDARKKGIHVVFSTIPDGLDDISRKMLESQFEVFDEAHSMISKKKGLAGMAENVRAGFRAGGRAPNGYQLKHHATGAIRDGKPVMKATLEPNADANLVSRYLKARARGDKRQGLINEMGIRWSQSTLVGMEWNALTYAGHTVWNVHNEFKKHEGYAGGTKRRPRKDWLIKKNTHQPLITESEANTIIDALENNSRSHKRHSPDRHLLVGLLETPSGDPWHGDRGKHYRLKSRRPGRWLMMDRVDRPVLSRIFADMQSPRFVRALLTASRATNDSIPVPGDDIRKQEAMASERITKLLEISEHLEDPAPCYREIDKIEKQRQALAIQAAEIQRQYEEEEAISMLCEADVCDLLGDMAKNAQLIDRKSLKALLNRLCERIVLDPETLECQIHYRIRAEHRISLASPSVRETNPVLRNIIKFKLAA